jgi:iron complex transport system substrate-binding protein
MFRSTFRIHRALAVTAVVAVAFTACGDDSPSPDASGTVSTVGVAATPPGTIATPSTEAIDVPTRIVSLSATATEMLFAIGAGDQVIAVDEQSNFPAAALAVQTALSGFEPNVEAISEFDPDLVLHDGTTALGDQLDALGVAHWVGAVAGSFDDIYVQIEELGAITGHAAEANELVEQMKIDIAAAIDSVPTMATPSRVYHELDSALYSVTSNTFIGQVYGAVGIQNIADTAEGGTDYPQLSAEFIISQNPDVIVFTHAKYSGDTAESIQSRPGWDVITAVTNGNVVALDDDIASRWGPRVVELIELVAAAASTAVGPG